MAAVLRRLVLSLLVVLLAVSAWPVAAESASDRHVTAIVLVIDTSGSMQGVKLEATKAAATSLLDIMRTLNDQSPYQEYRVAVVTFNSTADILLHLTDNFGLAEQKIYAISAGGSTDIGAGLNAAFLILTEAAFSQAAVLLLSDGWVTSGRRPSQIIAWLEQRHGSRQASVYGFDYSLWDRSDRLNTIDTAVLAGTHLEAYHFNVRSFANEPVSTALGRLPDDSVFAFHGHANVDRLLFVGEDGQASRLWDSDVKSLSRFPPLAVLCGCNTAVLDNPQSIGRAFSANGTVIVGFADIGCSCIWRRAFWPYLGEGMSVYHAAHLAIIRQLGYVKDRCVHYEDWFYYAPCFRDLVVYAEHSARQMTLQSIRPATIPVHTVGLGERRDFDEMLLKAIARCSGGHYIHSPDKFSLYHAFFLTHHHIVGGASVGLSGTVRQGETVIAGTVHVGQDAPEIHLSMNWPGSHLDLQLIAPGGREVRIDDPDVLVWRIDRPAYVVVANPASGPWTVNVTGSHVPLEGSSYDVIVSGGIIPPSAPQESDFTVLHMGLVPAALGLVLLFLFPRRRWPVVFVLLPVAAVTVSRLIFMFAFILGIKVPDMPLLTELAHPESLPPIAELAASGALEGLPFIQVLSVLGLITLFFVVVSRRRRWAGILLLSVMLALVSVESVQDLHARSLLYHPRVERIAAGRMGGLQPADHMNLEDDDVTHWEGVDADGHHIVALRSAVTGRVLGFIVDVPPTSEAVIDAAEAREAAERVVEAAFKGKMSRLRLVEELAPVPRHCCYFFRWEEVNNDSELLSPLRFDVCVHAGTGKVVRFVHTPAQPRPAAGENP